VALLSGVATATRPIDHVPAAAVDALVEAEMAMAMTGWATTTERVEPATRDDWERAITAADRAVQLAPGYAPALLARATMRLGYANDLLLARQAAPDQAGPLLDAATADFRVYTGIDDESYTAWWNLGWAAYLDGDAAAAIEATDRALLLVPDQFSLYLNRGLARLSAGDLDGHRADIDTALRVALAARLDSNGWFFAQNDHDIGRLAALRPGEAPQLMEVQRRIREAAVAARIARPLAAEGSGTISSVGIRSLTLDPDAELAEAGVVDPDASIAQDGVAGFRLALTGSDMPAGAIVSVRVWEDDVESPEYRIDRAWPDAATQLVIDLVSPYGRMGMPVDPAAYEIAVFVDGAARADHAFEVEAPTLAISASAFVDALAASDHDCEPPQAAGDGGQSTTCVLAGLTRDTGLEVTVTADAGDAIQRLVLSMPLSLTVAESIVRQTAGTWFSVLLNPSLAADAQNWIADAAPGTSTSLDGVDLSLEAGSGDAGRLVLEMNVR
jgi:hypothetical protein